MNQFSFSRPLIAAVLATAAWTFPAIAHAECASDADCGTGMICQTFDSQVCTAYACVDGQPCPAPTCEPVQYHECVPKPCMADSDCGDGMVCLTQTSTSCPPQPAYDCIDPNNCPKIEPVDCVQTTSSTCAPKYMAPCTVDADCGAGFNCVSQESCTCSGGGAVPPSSVDGGVVYADAGTASRDPLPSDCTCTATGVNSCEMQVIACTANSDCPADWTCVPYATGGTGCAVAVYPDGGTSNYMCDPAQQTTTTYSQCEPPYYNYGYGWGGVAYAGATDTSADAGVTSPPSYSTGTAGSGTGGAATSAPVVAIDPTGTGGSTSGSPTSVTDTATNGVTGGSGSHDSGGCQVGSGGANGVSGIVLAALGLFGILRRRRAYSASP
jgi:MYXO-CTERM domain-containing protein